MGNIDWKYVKQIVTKFVSDHQDQVLSVLGRIAQTIIIVILSLIVIKFGTMAIKKFFDKQREFKYKLDSKRTDTLATLCISILRYSVYFIALITILDSVFGITPTTIITAAGVGGLAIGFGAQNLVKDVITGFFILLEDQFSVGDIITIDGMMGTVEEMGLRITKIRHYAGDLYIIPNSQIQKVTNHTKGYKAAIVDVSIAYEENIDAAIEVLNKVCDAAEKEIPSVIERPQVLGVTNLGDSGVVIRVFAKTVAGTHWEVERQIRKRIKDTFDREGIEIPYTKVVVINNKSGT
ncbi:MAG: moderate conductance mechanosensitive channel [Clostridiales bacterium]|jgi:small conductance mechanosensitive channel|nr:moderate conductance mechanosensitive channel [Clostridiales bacterium]